MGLRIESLSASYNGRPALRGIDLYLGAGLTALLGPNGSGKTTLLRCLARGMAPKQGKLFWQGDQFFPSSAQTGPKVGYLPQELDLSGHLTPRSFLLYMAGLKGLVKAEDESRRLLASLDLETLSNRRFDRLSPGQSRLAAVAQAFLGIPDILLLDEPLRGLDFVEREAVMRLASHRSLSRTVLFSTHIPEEVDRYAGNVVALSEGQVVFAGKREGLRRLGRGSLEEGYMWVVRERARLVAQVEPLPGCISGEQED
jgi:ABC-2 type transport system ATP-binding protein